MPTTTSNFDLVEGDWKDFTFKRIEPTDHPKVLEHVVTYFLRDEPTCNLLGWTDEFAAEMCSVIKIMLQDNLSFMALDKASGEIAGVRITFSSKSLHLDELEIHQRQTEAFLNGIDLTPKEKDDVMRRFNVDAYAEFFVASTNPKFRNQGLAMEMYQRSLRFLRAEGFKLIKCIFTSATTRRAALKLGFEEVIRIDYKDLKDKNGKFVFPREILEPDHFCVGMVKYLE